MLDRPQRHAFGITAREMQVLRLVTQGLQDKAMARELGCAARTIETHMRKIQRKMGADNRAHVAALAVGLGMVRTVEPLRNTQ